MRDFVAKHKSKLTEVVTAMALEGGEASESNFEAVVMALFNFWSANKPLTVSALLGVDSTTDNMTIGVTPPSMGAAGSDPLAYNSSMQQLLDNAAPAPSTSGGASTFDLPSASQVEAAMH